MKAANDANKKAIAAAKAKEKAKLKKQVVVKVKTPGMAVATLMAENKPMVTVNDGRVDARELHGFLGVGKDFSSWIKDRIAKYDFVEGRDFQVPKSGDLNPGTPKVEYSLTLPMAKELSMVENNEQGKLARKYFIACEEAFIKNEHRQMSPAEILKLQAEAMIQTDSRLKALESKKMVNPEAFAEFGHA